jgi:hypothetical protein
LLGPVVGALLILGTSVELTTAYLYFDCRVRDELRTEETGDRLPAEIGLSV